MPANLARYLPALSDSARAELYGSIASVAAIPPRRPPLGKASSSVRARSTLYLCSTFRCLGFANMAVVVVVAYDDTMKVMIVAATALSVVPIVLALVMPNLYLGDTHNAVEDAPAEERFDEYD